MMRAFDVSRRYVPAAALAVLLTGCAVGPDYQRPEAVLPGEVAVATSQADQPAAAVKKDWWTLFQDATLNELVTQALAYNHDLLSAVARVEEAEGLAREANATFFPQIDLNAGASRSQVSEVTAIPLSSSTPRIRDARSAALKTSFEIDVWGKLRRANEAARAQVLASRYARDTVELSVAGLVTSGYLSLRAADASLALTQNTFEVRAKSLEIVKSRLQAGSASPIELHQAEGSLAAAEVQLVELRRLRALAQNQLALLTGKPDLRVAPGDLRQLPLPPVPPAGLPSALLEGRPDIRQAEESLISANAQIGVAKAALFPSLSLTGSLGSESAALSNLFAGGAGTWSLGLAAAMPIFDAGRNAARIDQASAVQKQSLIAYQKAVQTAFKEVNDALVGLRENAESERSQDKRVQAAQKTLELAQIRYEAGYSGFLDVLDAQRSANETLLASVSTRQSRLNSAVDLFKALGGGWQDRYQAESDENTGRKR
ncbi:efflux transporter outer membrane subunit [Propionivibrio sp.]|uniref:efflux transporter outer membrane subunit n=1 Tax=Propionivibrio sp. TaxID=2212460 RepID=UPI00272E7369|nr:efflux transporter outer membrane subunit [Propionivibrio sp.]